MPRHNDAARETRLKIVYAGAGLGGKTSSLKAIASRLPSGVRLTSGETELERTLLMDFMPVRIPLQQWSVVFNVHSVPGQVHLEESRSRILRGVDALVLVVDSAADQLDANLYAVEEVRRVLVQQGRDPGEIPVVYQYNKRDLPVFDAVTPGGALPLAVLQSVFNPGRDGERAPAFESKALEGVGVFRALARAMALAARASGLDVPMEVFEGEVVSIP